MKHKKFYIVFAFLVLVIGTVLLINRNDTSVKKVSISADYPEYDNLDNLIDMADTIIKGKVIDYKYKEISIAQNPQTDDERLNPGGKIDDSLLPYTIYTVEVKKTYKGNIEKTETIQIKEPGGIFGNTEYINENSANLNKGNNYVFFLETYPNSPASLLNPIQASYQYDDKDNIINDNNNQKIKFKMKDLDENQKLKK
ncbi:hypothetical protein [Paenibacillus glycanilyticus]|uniref:Uncharacterized protein n=1 Tax=Paenibacillus glycanilyticus TaxID=126569 RepID=A0ABQ6G9A4_9BACL|nr:hypothetical protein [Paenibacillus glycanilyticus]GLX66625.1 hypothetical protein MU1_09690 [Paenibacillus glycanilyticus]